MNGLLLKLSIDRIEFRVGSIIDCLRLEIIGWKFSESRPENVSDVVALLLDHRM